MKDWGVDINVELIEEQLVYGRVVAQIHPLARTSALLFVLAVTQDDIVVAFRASLGRRQPDLLVGRLLVDHVGADAGEVDGENAGLGEDVSFHIISSEEGKCSNWKKKDKQCGCTDGKLDINLFVLVLEIFEQANEVVEVTVGNSVVL